MTTYCNDVPSAEQISKGGLDIIVKKDYLWPTFLEKASLFLFAGISRVQAVYFMPFLSSKAMPLIAEI